MLCWWTSGIAPNELAPHFVVTGDQPDSFDFELLGFDKHRQTRRIGQRPFGLRPVATAVRSWSSRRWSTKPPKWRCASMRVSAVCSKRQNIVFALELVHRVEDASRLCLTSSVSFSRSGQSISVPAVCLSEDCSAMYSFTTLLAMAAASRPRATPSNDNHIRLLCDIDLERAGAARQARRPHRRWQMSLSV